MVKFSCARLAARGWSSTSQKAHASNFSNQVTSSAPEAASGNVTGAPGAIFGTTRERIFDHIQNHRSRFYQQFRTHYSYSNPGTFGEKQDDATSGHDHSHSHSHAGSTRSDWSHRGFTVGIGGPVGSGKTALVLKLTQALKDSHVPVGVVTNDIFTQEDAEFLVRHDALPSNLIRAVETGGCPHAAIREDVSANLSACEELTQELSKHSDQPALILCESGGDNLAANFSHELADLTLYVIDVAGGDKVPRKGGPGITQSDLLIVNKIDLAEAVGADLGVMRRDADKMRLRRRLGESDDGSGESGPTEFAAIRHGKGVPEIRDFILQYYRGATESPTTE